MALHLRPLLAFGAFLALLGCGTGERQAIRLHDFVARESVGAAAAGPAERRRRPLAPRLALLLALARTDAAELMKLNTRVEKPEVQAFPLWDMDGDGFIDKDEFLFSARKSLAALALAEETREPIIEMWYDQYFIPADLNHDSLLDKPESEYMQFLAVHGEDMWEDQGSKDALHTFDNVDTNQDGKVDFGEIAASFSQGLQANGWHKGLDPTTLALLRELFGEADLDGDGTFNFEELQYLLHIVALSDYQAVLFAAEMTNLVLEHWDVSGNGRLEKEEILRVDADARALSGDDASPAIVAMLLSEFDRYDKDKDGSLDKDEIEDLVGFIFKHSKIGEDEP